MRSLFSKVFLGYLVVLLIALGTVSLLLSTAFDRLYMSMAQRDLLARATAMAQQLGPFLDAPENESQLENIRQLVEASTGPETEITIAPLRPGQLVSQPPGRIRIGATIVCPGSVTKCGKNMLRADAILPGGRGVLMVKASMRSAVDTTVRQLRRQVFYAGLVAVALSLLVAIGLSERISGPLRRMRRLAGQMAEGDFSQRLNIKSGDEVGTLANSFDSLADSLRHTLADLSEEQARLRGILSSVAEGIIAVDAEGKVSVINPQAAALLQIGNPGAVGLSIHDLPLPANVVEQFGQCLVTNETCSVEFSLKHPQRYLVLQVAPVAAGETERWGAVAVLRDVTEARQLEEMRRRFISDASHEIRTPLTAIGGFASAIADGTAETEEERTRSAARIVREVERLSRLVNDLLDLSRIESGAERLDLEEVDLPEIITGAVEGLESQIQELGIRVETELPTDLPRVRADPDRVYQVLVNLVSNALRFNRQDGKIVIGARPVDGSVRVEVRDTGRGIPADEIPQIWERFHRADTSRDRQAGGTGLGLAIVRSIVEAHGGSVSAESAMGTGSTFSFTLPVNEPSQSE
ncbi:MAG: ATP-binding protein [Armatimonadota bacterium]|jgi:two-component system sensor histidine kinase ResE